MTQCNEPSIGFGSRIEVECRMGKTRAWTEPGLVIDVDHHGATVALANGRRKRLTLAQLAASVPLLGGQDA